MFCVKKITYSVNLTEFVVLFVITTIRRNVKVLDEVLKQTDFTILCKNFSISVVFYSRNDWIGDLFDLLRLA